MPLILPELDTRSVFNVVEENFQKIGLKAYANRMIYIGEHALPKEDIINHFLATIQGVNAGYCEINVRGLLLVYDSYFVHIIEGSEDTIHRQIRFLFQREVSWIKEMEQLDAEEERLAAITAEEAAAEGIVKPEEEPTVKPKREMFRRLKMLIVYHSIQTLLFHDWRAVTARPPSLVGKLDVYGPMPEHMEQLRVCLDKITKLCALAKAEEHLSFDGLSAVDPKMEALPEVALMDFLLQSKHIPDLRHVSFLHRRVDDYQFYFESVWPLPTHFTPRFLYKLKVDDSFVENLPVMSWEKKEKETGDEEEGKEDRESGSSSSDE